MSHPSANEIEHIARNVAADLCQHDPPAISGNASAVAGAVSDAIHANLKAEIAIIGEASAALRAMGAKTAGMDKETLLRGLRDGIAKKKGFAL